MNAKGAVVFKRIFSNLVIMNVLLYVRAGIDTDGGF